MLWPFQKFMSLLVMIYKISSYYIFIVGDERWDVRSGSSWKSYVNSEYYELGRHHKVDHLLYLIIL